MCAFINVCCTLHLFFVDFMKLFFIKVIENNINLKRATENPLNY